MNLLFKRSIYIIVLMTMIAGCGRNPPSEVIFNTGGPTMSQIYRGTSDRDVPQEVGFSSGQAEGYTRDAGNELDVLFPELENPRLVMYVFPHLTQNGHPVPGYSTAFYLYDSTQTFALPGEVQP